MLPTPDTSHVSYSRVYEPAEDSFLLLDTLSSEGEVAFLTDRFSGSSSSSSISTSSSLATTPPPPPLILEVGPGSGVVLAFLTAHAKEILGRADVLSLGVDANRFACAATGETVRRAVGEAQTTRAQEEDKDGGGRGKEAREKKGSTTGPLLCDVLQGDLATPLRPGQVDMLVFNPPYVPTEEAPPRHLFPLSSCSTNTPSKSSQQFEQDSRLLALAYAGGRDGMETTWRLLEAVPGLLSARGVAYVLLCASNRPEEVKGWVRARYNGDGGEGGEWGVETVGDSGRKGGREKLQIVRIWRR